MRKQIFSRPNVMISPHLSVYSLKDLLVIINCMIKERIYQGKPLPALYLFRQRLFEKAEAEEASETGVNLPKRAIIGEKDLLRLIIAFFIQR